MPSAQPPIILASSSVYRRELLARLQLPFRWQAPAVDETPLANETPVATALRLAQRKAQALSASIGPALIIGSDQVATLDQLQIGKPGNHANAMLQLQQMRGKSVAFHTALCLLDTRPNTPFPLQSEVITSLVRFRDLPDDELEAYLRIEQPYDCAGSAKNEGLGIAILEAIESTDPSALTGLPLIALSTMLRKTGVTFFSISKTIRTDAEK